MKSIVMYFFLSKNRFVGLVFVSYLLTIILFASIYQLLICLDTDKRRQSIPHFIINQDILSEKIRQNKFDIQTAIRNDSLRLLETNVELNNNYKKLPKNLLEKTTFVRNGKFYLKASIFEQIRNVSNIISWERALKDIVILKNRNLNIITKQILNDYLIWEHSIQLSQEGAIISQVHLVNGVNKICLSSWVIRQNDEYLEEYFNYRRGQHLLKWVIYKYRSLLAQQLKVVSTRNHLSEDYHIKTIELLSDKKIHIQKDLLNKNRILIGIINPDWSFWDIIFFTIVSLFANNYSDIYPNSTLARILIMLEFLIVWFLTICAISLEPVNFGFVKRWNEVKGKNTSLR